MDAGKIRKGATDWYTAVIFALILNVALFSVMPGLLSTASDMQHDAIQPHTVNVIRVKRREEPPKKRIQEKEPEQREESLKKHVKKDVFRKKPLNRLRLPFEINPSLPQMPGVTPTLYMEKYAVHGLDAYEMGDIDKPISPLAQVPPVYPMRARRLGIEGWVQVKLLVSEKGEVEQVEITESDPKGVFEDSVISCVQNWRFSPGTLYGEPVKTWVQTTIRFNLEND
ncbi:MAG: energy transducer TonB [Desulfobacterales bacterium]